MGYATGPLAGNHAALWNGSSLYTDLNPAGSNNARILGMVPGQQVGYAALPGQTEQAALWSGSSQSFLSLHAFPGYGNSYANATTGSIQVGTSNVPGYSYTHACAWFGTAGSFVDLNNYLPTGYVSSVAYAVAQIDGIIYVGGSASRDFQTTEAFVWTLVPTPSSAATVLLTSGLLARRRRC